MVSCNRERYSDFGIWLLHDGDIVMIFYYTITEKKMVSRNRDRYSDFGIWLLYDGDIITVTERWVKILRISHSDIM